MIRYLALDVQAERSLVVAMVGVEVVPERAERRGVEAAASCLSGPDMIRIVRGDLPLHAALAEERLDVAGPSLARGWRPVWFNRGPLAAVRSERAEAEPSPRGTRRSAH